MPEVLNIYPTKVHILVQATRTAAVNTKAQPLASVKVDVSKQEYISGEWADDSARSGEHGCTMAGRIRQRLLAVSIKPLSGLETLT